MLEVIVILFFLNWNSILMSELFSCGFWSSCLLSEVLLYFVVVLYIIWILVLLGLIILWCGRYYVWLLVLDVFFLDNLIVYFLII